MNTFKKLYSSYNAFTIPLILVIASILYFLLLDANKMLAVISITAAILLGSYRLVKEIILSLFKKHFALDYIALTAIIVSLITQQYIVGIILAIMISGGEALENYASSRAKKSLTKLISRIPSQVTLWENNSPGKKKHISSIKLGKEIFIRKGEVIPLDGILMYGKTESDESSLTGEPYFVEKETGDLLRSGTVNIGQMAVIKVTKTEENSTYTKIIEMVKKAGEEKSPMIRLADKYSTFFTIITFVIAGFSWLLSDFSLTRVLAVLAVATPCPLIIATPIALIGGVNASAKKNIIVKELASLEVLSRITALVFDKTGTITFGTPQITNVSVFTKSLDEAVSIAAAIERNSLHPLAKAIILYAKENHVQHQIATNVTEEISKGISGVVNKKTYFLSKQQTETGMELLLTENNKKIASFSLEDKIKQDAKKSITLLQSVGLKLFIYTGDKQAAAEKVAQELGNQVTVKAECTPEEKQQGILRLKQEKNIIAMVGDGINDAPALALADVGMAFSNEEQTAATESADIVFLGGDFSNVLTSLMIAKKTITIAKQSIRWGIGLSILAMLFASFGKIPPLAGAGLQEAIDVAVILNALRASR